MHYPRLISSLVKSHSTRRLCLAESLTGRTTVLVTEENWRAIQETLYLLSIRGMRKSILEGMKTPVSRCAKKISW